MTDLQHLLTGLNIHFTHSPSDSLLVLTRHHPPRQRTKGAARLLELPNNCLFQRAGHRFI